MVPKDLPFSRSNDSIDYFRHALALDEHRVKFIPSFYREHDGQSVDSQSERRENTTDTDAEPAVKEVFFAGVHCGSCWFPPAYLARDL